MADGVLSGIGVVVTRPPGRADEPGRTLRAAGADVVELPVTRVVARDDPWTDAERTAVGAARIVVFTSARGVREFARQILAAGCTVGADAVVVAVGPRTADAAREHDRPADLVPGGATGAAIVDALAATHDLRGVQVLLARARGGRPELATGLADAGAVVTDLPLYETVPAPPSPDALEQARACPIWTFMSPSSVDGVLAVVDPTDLAARAVVSIGPTTSAHLRALGIPVAAEAAQRTAAGIAAAVTSVARTLGATDG